MSDSALVFLSVWVTLCAAVALFCAAMIAIRLYDRWKR